MLSPVHEMVATRERPDNLGEVAARVKARVGNRARHLWLEVDEGGLVLRGYAPTYYVKQLAQHALMQLTDVPIRRNAIDVSQGSGRSGSSVRGKE